MEEFVSEVLRPLRGTADAKAMSTGLPGLPTGFVWHDEEYHVVEQLEAWKHSSREGGRASGELYLRRHYYRLRMSDDSIWTVYFTRQPSSAAAARRRWFLFSREEPEPPESPPGRK